MLGENSSDPFAKLALGTQRRTGAVVRRTLAPEWFEPFSFSLELDAPAETPREPDDDDAASPAAATPSPPRARRPPHGALAAGAGGPASAELDDEYEDSDGSADELVHNLVTPV